MTEAAPHLGTARAFGKVILLGEHAVVYGHPALAGALAEGVRVDAQAGTGRVRIPRWGVEIDPATPNQELAVGRAYLALRERLGVGASSPVDLTVHFDVPTGAGLGSSAAMAVALARALASAHRLESDSISEAAMASERVIHGNPSGLDHTVSARGGFGLFTRARGFQAIAAEQPIRIVVGDTGRARDTKGRLERVAEIMRERESEVRARFAAIEQLVRRAEGAIGSGRHNLGELGEAMNENQRHLAALDVSCPEIDRLCAIAADAGAVGAKLTGGGGGGCVIALAPGREPAVQTAWQRAGHSSFIALVGGGAGR